jgi:hypothetical protein
MDRKQGNHSGSPYSEAHSFAARTQNDTRFMPLESRRRELSRKYEVRLNLTSKARSTESGKKDENKPKMLENFQQQLSSVPPLRTESSQSLP